MKEIITTTDAPGAIGPYSQAVAAFGKLVFVSGQLPIDMETGELADGIKAQTQASLRNMQSILAAYGCTPEDVVKATVFLADMNDFVDMNREYAKVFVQNHPARSAVQVARLPKDALVEIECIAIKR